MNKKQAYCTAAQKLLAAFLLAVIASAAFAGCSPKELKESVSEKSSAGTAEQNKAPEESESDEKENKESDFAFEAVVWDGTAAQAFASGSGTENDPYVIMTAEQLKYFGDTVSGGTTYSGKYVILGADIILNDSENWESWATTAPNNSWTPIGTSANSFFGNFDGKNHTVSGIYINESTDIMGLFSYAAYAEIKNITVEKSFIKGQNKVGAIVGFINCSTISNCVNNGIVIGNNAVGGIVGYSDTYRDGKGMIENCLNNGTVSGNDPVGGIIGYNEEDDTGSENSTVINCSNSGAIIGKCCGGIAGSNCSILKNCLNTGNINGSFSAGGVAGWNGTHNGHIAVIYSCSNSGSVSVSGETVEAGGIVPHNESGTVSKCRNTGSVLGEGGFYANVGGIVGMSSTVDGRAEISNCYNAGTVTGTHYIAGIAGSNSAYNEGNTASLINCYNCGSVAGMNDTDTVGGIVGDNTWFKAVAEITNCYYLDTCVVEPEKSKEPEGIALGESQMKDKANYAGFDFETVWEIGVSTAYDYPTLK